MIYGLEKKVSEFKKSWIGKCNYINTKELIGKCLRLKNVAENKK